MNITFEKKETITSKELSDLLHNEITNIRRVIVNTKMDYLFQYKTEEEIVEQFDELKKNLNELQASYSKALSMYLNIIDNKEKKKIL